MSRTQIGRNQIKPKSITVDHFIDTLKIPESYLNLIYPSHTHINKSSIDKIRYTGSKDTVDLRDLDVLYLEVIGSRKDGYSLAGTLDLKADLTDFNAIKQEITDAKSGYNTLYEAMRAYNTYVENEINAHKGVIQHTELDQMYYDYISSKAGMMSLADRLNTLGSGTGTGSVTVNVLTPWRYNHIITNSSLDANVNRTITLPNGYTPNSNAIEVFEGAILMESGPDKDYTEVDDHTIRFNYDLPTGSIVNIKGLNGSSLYLWKQLFFTVSGQKSFSFIGEYNTGTDDLEVYESGLLMTKGADYEETNSKTITFTEALPANVIVTVQRRR